MKMIPKGCQGLIIMTLVLVSIDQVKVWDLDSGDPNFPDHQQHYSYHTLHPTTTVTESSTSVDSIYNSIVKKKESCNCVGLRSCVILHNYLQHTTLTPTEIWQLRKADCGFNEKNEMMVCCPNRLPNTPKHRHRRSWLWEAEDELPYWDVVTTKQPFLAPFEDHITGKNNPPVISFEFETFLDTALFDSSAPVTAGPPVYKKEVTEKASTIEATTEAWMLDKWAAKLSLINQEDCGVSMAVRIMGGQDANPGQFRWMARLAYRNISSNLIAYRCGGSVISSRYVLTAAHCVDKLNEDLQLVLVRVGELDDRTDVDCNGNQTVCSPPAQDLAIERVIVHAHYDTPKYANDIAVIRLKEPVAPMAVCPICLPMGDEYAHLAEDLTGVQGVVAGWGAISRKSSDNSPVLQYLNLPIIDTTACAKTYAQFSALSKTPIILSDNQICAQGKPNMDACQGDSGGPMMREDERYVLIGVVSFGPRACGLTDHPGVYTRVTSYIDWILENIEV